MHQPTIYPLVVLLASGLFSTTFAAPTSHAIKRTPQPQGASQLDPSELVVIPIDDGTDPLTLGTPFARPDPITVAPSTGGTGTGTGTDTGGSNGVSGPALVAVRNIHTSAGTGTRTLHPELRERKIEKAF